MGRGATMEARPDFALRDGDVGGHIDQVAEDEARLGVVVAAHAAGHETIETEARTSRAMSKSHNLPLTRRWKAGDGASGSTQDRPQGSPRSGLALIRSTRAIISGFACQTKLTFGRRTRRLHQDSACGGQARENETTLRYGF
jgi:hypothetical protein